MKILWVEDTNEHIEEGILKYFGSFLYKHEKDHIASLIVENQGSKYKTLKKYLSEKTCNRIHIESCLLNAYQQTKKEVFDVIVLDVNFPFYSSHDPTDEEEKEIKDLQKHFISDDSIWSSRKKEFEIIWNQQYAGFILFSLLWELYKKERCRTVRDIKNSICFFSGNGIDVNKFKEDINKVRFHCPLYDSDAFAEGQGNFFQKPDDEKFRQWIKGDPYIRILESFGDSKAGVTAFAMYSTIIDNRKCEPTPENVRITLITVRNLLAIILEKLCHLVGTEYKEMGIPATIEMFFKEYSGTKDIAEADFAKSIQRFCSRDGVHIRLLESLKDDNREFSKYLDLRDAMIASIKYLILWYGEITEKYKNTPKTKP